MQTLIQVETTNNQLLPNYHSQDYRTHFSSFNRLFENHSYIPLPHCLLEYILTSVSLSSYAKLFYIIGYSLSSIEFKRSERRSIGLSAKLWAKRLNCSKSQVFKVQQELVTQGYILIAKQKDQTNRNKRNLITPTIPASVFKLLANSTNLHEASTIEWADQPESDYLEYLSKTKLFIPLNYQLLKLITSAAKLSQSDKIIWLDCYIRGYKSYISSGKTGDFTFITSNLELIKHHQLSGGQLSKILSTSGCPSFTMQ